jgi:hypothetical protein
MNEAMKRTVSGALIAALVVSSCASSGFGAPAEGRPYNRTIVVDERTPSVSVGEGEVIRFIIRSSATRDASFTWSFDTFGDRVADLRTLAPRGIVDRRINVYIAADSRAGQ